MAFTSYAGLVSTVANMDVDGIAETSKFAFRPKHINVAQMPILYTRIPSAERQTSTLGYAQGLKMGVIEIVVLVGPMTLNTQENNDANTVTMLDALVEALEENAQALGMDSYSIVPDEDAVGDVPYQALVATVEVSG